MKRIDAILAKFLWRYPGLKIVLIILIMIGIVAGIIPAIPTINEDFSLIELIVRIIIFLPLPVIICTFLWFSIFSKAKWEIPGYVIQEAEKIFNENPLRPDFKKLKELIDNAKTQRKVKKVLWSSQSADDEEIVDLRQWVKDFKEYEEFKALGKEYLEMETEQNELMEKILKNGEKMKLRKKLGITEDDGMKELLVLCSLRKKDLKVSKLLSEQSI